MILEWIFIMIIAVNLVQDVIFLILLQPTPIHNDKLGTLPFVSILMSVRNEEKNLTRSLESLKNVNYPKDRHEILIGDDQSEDRSVKIINRHKSDNIKLYLFDSESKEFPAKAGVLNELIKRAKGEILLITDADIKVDQEWINTMISCQGAPIISGCTKIEGLDRMARLQNMEWLSTLSKLKTLSDIDIHPTANGNNLKVQKQSLVEIGGFNSLHFNSINEDHELAQAFNQSGNPGFFIFNKIGTNLSRPEKYFKNLINQRQRWICGAVSGPLWQTLLLVFQILMLPLIISLIFINFKLGISLLLLKILIQALYFRKISRIIGDRFSLPDVMLYEPYYLLVNLISLIYYLLPVPFYWKGRNYT